MTADSEGVYSLGAEGDGCRAALITNESTNDVAIKTNLDKSRRAYIVDDTRELTEIEIDPSDFLLRGGSFVLLKSR